ncbi:hypothetical protein BJ741DRAFT_622253 [Chytriomyces cf. hyalinus JEL632]|nr:hypothetical protein BJ741DRAFT_622253 [Chytriomyces cf. hyalinus JEL632]
MSNQELLNELIQLEKEVMAFHLATAARRNTIIEKLRAGDMLNVQASNLDIALVPAEASTKFNVEHDNHNCQKGELLERLRDMESQVTLLEEELVGQHEGLSMVTAPDLNSEEYTADCSSTAGFFSYCLYTDPMAIAAEMPWQKTQVTEVTCSHPVGEQADIDACGATLDTPQYSDEPAIAVVTGGGTEEDHVQDNATMSEQYSYCLYADQTVIATEVSWAKTQDALAQCSKFPVEFFAIDGEYETETGVQPAMASKPRSVSSGSLTKTKKRRVYRPPAKGVSPRLSQEEVNKISLQRSKR